MIFPEVCKYLFQEIFKRKTSKFASGKLLKFSKSKSGCSSDFQTELKIDKYQKAKESCGNFDL